MDMVWVIKKELVNYIFNYGVTPTASKPAKDKPCFRKQLKTKQRNVNSLNFVVDSLLHALQVVKCLEFARGRSRCGIRTVMFRV